MISLVDAVPPTALKKSTIESRMTPGANDITTIPNQGSGLHF
jgi:hypothetical protein